MESILNFRTLTGLKTRDNAVIRDDKLFRSAAPENGTDKDFTALHQLNLDTIIDFRDENEKKISLEEKFNAQFHRKSAAINVANFLSNDQTIDQPLSDTTIDLYFQEIYRSLPISFHEQYQTLISELNQGHTILWHCTAGKDRTGVGAYLILSALNVHPDDIMEDYLRSNEASMAMYNARKQESLQELSSVLSESAIKALFSVKAEYLEASIQSIIDHHKNVQHYLSRTLSADIDKIRQYYLL